MRIVLCNVRLMTLAWLATMALGVSAAEQPPVPPLPPVRCPVDTFRELLAMSRSERAQALTNRPPAVRARLLAKLQEYEAMPADERELRLRATELRWYLLPLLRLPPAQRPALDTVVPPSLRPLVADRLQQWDRLSPQDQTELLDNALALDYFTSAGPPDPAQQQRLLDNLPPAQRERLEAEIARWQAMSPDARQRLLERLNRFFDLGPAEQKKVLQTLSETEQRQMEATLEAFAKLPREQRLQCIRAFGKFAELSAAERQQFLKNAERWSALSAAEREAWRKLVRKLPELPPMPPGFTASVPPPLPPSMPPRVQGLATNGR